MVAGVGSCCIGIAECRFENSMHTIYCWRRVPEPQFLPTNIIIIKEEEKSWFRRWFWWIWRWIWLRKSWIRFWRSSCVGLEQLLRRFVRWWSTRVRQCAHSLVVGNFILFRRRRSCCFRASWRCRRRAFWLWCQNIRWCCPPKRVPRQDYAKGNTWPN